MTGHLYIVSTIVFTVYGQLILKWQVAKAGALPVSTYEKMLFLLRLLMNGWVLSGFLAAFLASLCWMAAMTKFDLSYAYPFMSLAFVGVLLLSALFFHEPLGFAKVSGVALIVAGLCLVVRG